MKTSTFKVMKQNFLGLLERHPLVQNAKQVQTATATTDTDLDADMEYLIDAEMEVNGNDHKVKLKVFNTDCRIQVQHAGKNSSHTAKDYLDNKCPPRYFAEEIILPFRKTINDSIPVEKERELKKKEKTEKNATKVNKKGKCINLDCKSGNNLDITNVEKYG